MEERAGCFAWLVFLVSSDCCVALPRGAMGLSVFFLLWYLLIILTIIVVVVVTCFVVRYFTSILVLQSS